MPGSEPPIRVGLNLLWIVPGDVGGSEEYVDHLLDHAVDPARAAGVELTAFASEAFFAAHPRLRRGLAAVPAPTFGGRLGRVGLEATWLAREVRRRRLGLVHHLGGTVPVVRAAPAVVTIHDLQPLEHPERFSPVKRWYLGAMLPRAVRADAVVAVSATTARAVEARFGLAAGAVGVVRHGAPDVVDIDPAVIDAVRQRHRLGADWFVYPAKTWVHKNHVTAVRAFAKVAAERPGTALVLTGAAGEAEDDLLAVIAELGLRDAVRRTGRIDRADLDALVAGARGLVFPSTFEGFGAPVLEAMALGCPVVAAPVGPIAEVAGDAALLVDPHDVDGWSQAMLALLAEPGLGEGLRAAGRARARALTWDDPVSELIATWRTVAREAAP